MGGESHAGGAAFDHPRDQLFGTDPEFLWVLGSAIGREGTESDLRFWSEREGALALTALGPITYMDRVLSMLQAAVLRDFLVLVADRLDAALGETVVAIEATGKRGLFVLGDPATADRIHALVRERLSGWVTLEQDGEDTVRRLRALLGILKNGVPVRLEPNGYFTPGRRVSSCTASKGRDPPREPTGARHLPARRPSVEGSERKG
ncbi:MAG: hypothetical protein A3K68_03890 [Euryarchaeota archaeon RBG_16_68_13]|nr:MAG: hypothetical protein A3K68_03890 [Euryarchaeota archaeon RBG_16_68_13]